MTIGDAIINKDIYWLMSFLLAIKERYGYREFIIQKIMITEEIARIDNE